MGSKSGLGSMPAKNIDKIMLVDMVDVDTLNQLLESFGQVCNVGAGIFTPAGIRIGEAAHHRPFCQEFSKTPQGRAACLGCDKRKINILRKGKVTALRDYKCHAGLIDFCEPIYCRVGRKRRLIGVFFAGQVLYEDKEEIKKKTIKELERVAAKCKIDSKQLVAKYIDVPRVSRRRIREIRAWMRQFSRLIGLLVERKAATQQLLLSVIASADDPDAVVKSIQNHLMPARVSIFLKRDDVSKKFIDRIFLVAATSKELASRLPVETDLDKISYKRGEGLTGWVYATGMVLHIPNVHDRKCYPTFPYSPEWKHKIKEIPSLARTQAFLGAPIRSDKGQIIGVIRATRRKNDPEFKRDEIELLRGIASLVGVAASKARLYKEHGEKIAALNQAQGLLEKLTESGTSLDSITKDMVEQLGYPYVTRGKWNGVYVLQHLNSSAQFRFVASFPPNLRKEFHGEPFSDKKGVAGYILHKTRKTFASTNCAKEGVKPTTPWTSVVCAPIYHGDKMWGAVSLCSERELSQTDVDLATPKITKFAEDMSLVCRLSETLDAKDAATLVASNVLSLNLEAHEVYKSLESSKSTVDHLYSPALGKEQTIVEKLANQIDDSLSWADVCLDLGEYIKLCQINPGVAIKIFRNKHLRKKKKKPDGQLGYPWKEISIAEVAQRALSSVQLRIDTLQTDMKPRIVDGGGIVGDKNLLYRAFRNLLENAIVHGSKILGKEGRFKKGLKVYFSVMRNNSTGITKIVVQDKGVGMNTKILAASKEVYANPTFFGRASLTPGFGTAIVAFAISVHHGNISLDSRQGKGTKVTIKIPSRKGKGKINEKDNHRR